MRTVDRYLQLQDEIERLEARLDELAERMVTSGVRYLPNSAGTECVVVQARPQYRFSGTVDILEQTIAGLQQRLMEQKQREIRQGKAEPVEELRYCTVATLTPRIRAALDRETGDLLSWPDEDGAASFPDAPFQSRAGHDDPTPRG